MMTSTCRLCLCEPKTAHSLLEKGNFDMLEALTSIRILSTDLSTVACTKCLEELTQAFNIQQRILQTNEKFKAVLEVNDFIVIDENEVEHTDPLIYKSCPVCVTSVEESALTQHIKTHFECPQYCDVCQNTFSNLKQYKEHWNSLHTDEGVYKCTICDLQFRYRCIYFLHMKKAHDSEVPQNVEDVSEGSKNDVMLPEQKISCLLQEPQRKEETSTQTIKTIDCAVCQKEFSSWTRLQSHMQSHKKKQCTICNAEISSANFSAHVKDHKLDPRICEICGSILRNSSSLRSHMRITHTDFKKSCETCGKVFTHVYRYQLHLKKHKGDKSYVCETCGKAFYTRFYLNAHNRSVHLKLRPHNCLYCQKAFSSSFAKKTHERQHTLETPFNCEVCGEGFRQRVSMRSHLKSKHGIVEEKTCECTVCGKGFASEHALISHSTKQHG